MSATQTYSQKKSLRKLEHRVERAQHSDREKILELLRKSDSVTLPDSLLETEPRPHWKPVLTRGELVSKIVVEQRD